MAYKLGPVKPFVSDVANSIGPKFGIKTVYGWGPGSVPNSDHPRGLALDFMISNIPNGRSTGDALSTYVIQNYNALNVKYVIWYRRIWSPDKGWRGYSGPSAHTDHVHVSFNSGSGSIPAGFENVGVVDTATSVWNALKQIDKAATWIVQANNIRRVAYFILGFLVILIAIVGLSGVTGAAKNIAKQGKGA